jgi:hypothetical protein
MELLLNGATAPYSSIQNLRASLTESGRQFGEVWLEATDDGPALCMLVNGNQAFLIYLGDNNGDLGFTSRNPRYEGPMDAVMEFELSNGQIDEYPAAWAVPLNDALEACEHFVASGGGRSPDITWHDDSSGDEC